MVTGEPVRTATRLPIYHERVLLSSGRGPRGPISPRRNRVEGAPPRVESLLSGARRAGRTFIVEEEHLAVFPLLQPHAETEVVLRQEVLDLL